MTDVVIVSVALISCSLVTTTVLVMVSMPAGSGLFTVTAKVTVTLCPALMVTSLARVGGTVPVMPALGGSRVMLSVTKSVLAGSVSETNTPVAYPRPPQEMTMV